ncbi:L,D-transpeptidase [Vulcanococcus limneticus]|uniref:L,D-transpeptidase n=1 Tax=Vulcanococcus limneticus TaxID=2170428 RepID=UPI001E49F3CD|nr:L,D-transpeptidase [Vulcanococcus limneticus]
MLRLSLRSAVASSMPLLVVGGFALPLTGSLDPASGARAAESGGPAPAPTVESAPAAGVVPAARQAPAAAVATGSDAADSRTEIRLVLSKREISLLRDGKVEGRWPVVIGAPKTPTPTGTYKVMTKVVNPVYRSTVSGQVKGAVGRNGPLGHRWIGFLRAGQDDYGIHGTPWPWWVDARAAVSQGCVRMRNEHVEKLFESVSIGTPVVIKP